MRIQKPEFLFDGFCIFLSSILPSKFAVQHSVRPESCNARMCAQIISHECGQPFG